MPQYATSPPRSERAELPQRPDVRQPDAVAAGSQLDERQAALLVELVVESWNYYDVAFGIADRFYDGKINVMNTKRGRVFYDITGIHETPLRKISQCRKVLKHGYSQGGIPSDKSQVPLGLNDNLSEKDDLSNSGDEKFSLRRQTNPLLS